VPLARAVSRARTFLAPRDEAAGGALSGLPPAASGFDSCSMKRSKADCYSGKSRPDPRRSLSSSLAVGLLLRYLFEYEILPLIGIPQACDETPSIGAVL
jgi:hypothetical protein